MKEARSFYAVEILQRSAIDEIATITVILPIQTNLYSGFVSATLQFVFPHFNGQCNYMYDRPNGNQLSSHLQICHFFISFVGKTSLHHCYKFVLCASSQSINFAESKDQRCELGWFSLDQSHNYQLWQTEFSQFQLQ